MKLKQKLIELMQQHNMTIKELANNTDISEPTLKRLRTRDNCNPTLDVLTKLAEAFDIPLSELLEDQAEMPTFKQNDEIDLPNNTDKFIYIFTKDTFGFKNGTKAIFKKHTENSLPTKYIISKDGKIMEKTDEERMLFKNEDQDIFSMENKNILAFIIKELYEVNYV
jgi:transcriptional regulator with XRE-family HTH domain